MQIEGPIVTEIVRFDYTVLPPGYAFRDHLHHFFQLDVFLMGEVTVRVEGLGAVRAGGGDGLFIPPLVRHGYESHPGFRQGSFKFHLAPSCWTFFGTRPQRLRVPDDLVSVVERAGQRFNANSLFGRQEAVAAANLCLIELLGESCGGTAALGHLDAFRRVLWPLLEKIANRPYAGWTVAGMARECHMSESHFTRSFHQLLGQTPRQYLLEARMRAVAAELVADPPRPIKDIAESANYATVHAFSAAFKKIFSASPAAYRRARPGL